MAYVLIDFAIAVVDGTVPILGFKSNINIGRMAKPAQSEFNFAIMSKECWH